MAISVTNSFAAEAQKTVVTSVIRQFTFVGSDLTAKLTSFPVITRDATEVLGRNTTFNVDNTGQEFNSIVTSKPGYFTKVCTLSFGFGLAGGDEKITLFSGQMQHASFEEMNTDLTFSDRLAFLRRIKIGTDDATISFTESDYNPADLAWFIVVSYGGLNSTTNTTNPDIDWSSLQSWKAIFNTNSVTVQALFSGEDVIELLDDLKELTDSVIYVDQDNKIFFNKWVGLPGDSHTIVDSTVVAVSDYNIDGDNILNNVDVLHGYVPSVSSWVSFNVPVNQFENRGFEDGDTSSWNIVVNTDASATLTADATAPQEGIYSGKITIASGGAANNSIEVYPEPIDGAFYSDINEYKLSFWAKSTGRHDIELTLTDANCSNIGLGLNESIGVSTTAWINYNVLFTPTGTTSARLNFLIGDNSGDLHLDTLSLTATALGRANAINSLSQSQYGVHDKVYDKTNIWFPNSRSANWLAQWVSFGRGEPNTSMNVKIPMVFPQATVGDITYFTYAPYGYAGVGFNMNRISYDINNGTMDIFLDEGFGFGGGRLAGFILDDSYYGLLDNVYNPLF